MGGGGSAGMGGGGAGGSAGAGGVCVPQDYVPTANDIGFTPLNPVPSGEQILFNTWSLPDAVFSMRPDGTSVVEIFRVYRVWSFGVANGRDRLAFACGDPNQEQHYCLNLGDAIQHTWLYDFATQQIELVAGGATNDECHEFSPNDDSIYVCRRYDFTPDLANKGYRIGRIALPAKDFSWITDESAAHMDLYGQPTADESELYFTRVINADFSRTVQKMALPAGTPALALPNASGAVLSPDGTRLLYVDTEQDWTVFSSRRDGSDVVHVVNAAGSDLQYSPDGSRVAYLVYDDSVGCSHIETAAADGSEVDSPVRIRDCAQTGDFITQLAWFGPPGGAGGGGDGGSSPGAAGSADEESGCGCRLASGVAPLSDARALWLACLGGLALARRRRR
jgi:hypothetical protein